MGECVVRMEMPSKDRMCRMANDIDGVWYCPVMKKLCRQPDNGEIPSWCPIICSLPEGHGRLIDEHETLVQTYLSSDGRRIFDLTLTVKGVLGEYAKSVKTIVPAAAERS